MKINLLHLLLVLIAMQSTMVVADLHQLHQSGQDHLSFDHTEADDLVVSINLDNFDPIEANLVYDCHHCCHCHGVACHYMDNIQNDYVYSYRSPNLLENLTFLTSRITSPNLRPPIV